MELPGFPRTTYGDNTSGRRGSKGGKDVDGRSGGLEFPYDGSAKLSPIDEFYDLKDSLQRKIKL